MDWGAEGSPMGEAGDFLKRDFLVFTPKRYNFTESIDGAAALHLCFLPFSVGLGILNIAHLLGLPRSSGGLSTKLLGALCKKARLAGL